MSNYAEDADFCKSRFLRIQSRAQTQGLTVSEDKTKSYQHLITFSDGRSNSATYQLWYGAKGYNAKDKLLSSSSEDFSSICTPIIEASYAPEHVPFSAPDRPFAEKLVSFIRSQLDETGIQLLDITQENYQDVFHLQ